MLLDARERLAEGQRRPGAKSAPPVSSVLSELTGGIDDEFISPDDVRLNPSYYQYYYSNKNTNPRLPPPLFIGERNRARFPAPLWSADDVTETRTKTQKRAHMPMHTRN
jgi:hypothetical protein